MHMTEAELNKAGAVREGSPSCWYVYKLHGVVWRRRSISLEMNTRWYPTTHKMAELLMSHPACEYTVFAEEGRDEQTVEIMAQYYSPETPEEAAEREQNDKKQAETTYRNRVIELKNMMKEFGSEKFQTMLLEAQVEEKK